MGSILIETMVRPDSELSQAKKLHPFFTKAPHEIPPPLVAPTHEAVDEDTASNVSADTGGDSHKKRRKGDDSASLEEQAPKKRRQRKSTRTSIDGTITAHLNRPPVPEVATSQLQQTATDNTLPPLSNEVGSSVDVGVQEEPTSTPDGSTDALKRTDGDSTKRPATLLKLDPKTGTFGLPSKLKEKNVSRIVTIKYGQDDTHRATLAKKIMQILNDKPPAKRRGRKPRHSGQTEEVDKSESRALQAFFVGKAPKMTVEPETSSGANTSRNKSPPRKNTIFMSTPVSPHKTRNPVLNLKPPIQWGSTKPVGTKVPGALHPSWPSQDTAHVRGDDDYCLPNIEPLNLLDGWVPRKFKGQITSCSFQDSVLNGVIQRLDLMSIYESLHTDDNQIENPPAQLRRPTRLFESGPKLQRRMCKELHSNVAFASGHDDYEDELNGNKGENIHPYILRLYQDLQANLSAYDCSTCENSAWAQKYAPTEASQVLQHGKDAFYLKEWLEALQVQSVDKGSFDLSIKSKGKTDKAPKKRKKKKLDDFIVDTDESDGMEEISEDEGDWTATQPGLQRKSIVRRLPTKNLARLANSIIISGPHGSGKTAAVYAVAKELDFEIFEINPGNRRSGRDVLEKVGDMTRNHLVQHHHTGTAASEPGEAEEDEGTKDLKSGKQGTMTSFFKPKPTKTPKPLPSVQKSKDTAVKEDKKPTPKTQRQSLILLEEVDVLYEEDRQFWATLMGLMAQSRRPFIMTCNDESLVPIQALHLHGILRFSPPPTNLAVDSCLLMAANEGHALRRPAVEALYASRGHDLRATISELNYWCQIGVGDRRGGFDWFYLRWPKGSDRDECGHVVRVISQDTYTKGMGWLGRDLLCTSSHPLEAEEEALRQCWESWGTLIGDWPSSLPLASGTGRSGQPLAQHPHISLNTYQQLLDSLSDSDMLSGGSFCLNVQQDLIDPSVPDLTPKTKEDYILGQQLLEATLFSCPTQLSTSISLSVSSLARQEILEDTLCTSNETCSILSPVGEDKATSILDSTFHSTAEQSLTRRHLSLAFDPVASSEGVVMSSTLDPSVFDRTLTIIVNDVAPWVRSIVAYDQSLMLERRNLSNLLSEGGQRKRMRNTRSAYSALEGGERKSTRRENYFRGEMNTKGILDTGLKAWQDAAQEELVHTMGEEEPRRETSLERVSGEDTGSDGLPEQQEQCQDLVAGVQDM